MTTYYVSSSGSNTSPYDTWAKAATALASVMNGTTGTAGDIVYVDANHSEVIGATTTFAPNTGSTIADPVRILCVTPDGATGNSGLATTAVVQATSTAYAMTFTRRAYYYGITFDSGSTGTGSADILLGGTTSALHFEQCVFKLSTNSGSQLHVGNYWDGGTILRNCSIHFRHASSCIYPWGWSKFIGCTISAGTTHPTILFLTTTTVPPVECTLEGCDLTNVTGTIVDGGFKITMVGCKLGSGVDLTNGTTYGAGIVECFDCNVGDVHYEYRYSTTAGDLSAEATIKMNSADAAKHDGTNIYSWKIVTTANCSYLLPFVCPAIDVYHSGTSAITPYLEILRNDSATAFNNDEVWSEWSFKGTSGATTYTVNSSRRALLDSAAALADGAGLTTWDGESGTAKSSKVVSPSMTPAELGYIRGRVVVGKASATVYVNPKILGLS